jgi:2-oxoglutarate ferredoxin oxidoreductase subunit beta
MSTNQKNLTRQDYAGNPSTLCSGCGHDSITNNIVSALFLSSTNPYKLAKMSGIGCSSKTTAYFLNKSSGFNSLHGRMAPVATGAKLAQRDLTVLGISGDGDSASIGLGGFVHLLRRNLPMVYIVENNGVYGLTKGQFSATADQGSTIKSGEVNPFESIDLCALALELGTSFVARSFSGDAKQLVPLIQAALKHNGTAFIDVISPCVTFANHDGSTKSYNAVREHKKALQELGYVDEGQEIVASPEEGQVEKVRLHDGSYITIRKIDPRAHSLTDPASSLKLLRESRQNGEILTGLFYVKEDNKTLIDQLKISDKPLAFMTEDDLRLSFESFQQVLHQFT